MAVRNLDAFKSAKSANDKKNNAMLNAKKAMLISLIEEIKPFVNDMADIRDTYRAVKNEDEKYAAELWHFIIGYNEKDGYTHKYKMDCNSYFGVHYSEAAYYTNVVITPNGVAIFFDPKTHGYVDDWKSKGWKGDNAISFIEEHDFTEEILDAYIASVSGLLEWFPKYAEKFFDLVENPIF